MATVQDIVELVAKDSLSAAMNAGTASIDRYTAAQTKAAAATVASEEKTRVLSQTAEGMVGRFDQATKAQNTLANATEAYNRRAAELKAGLDGGRITVTQYVGAMAGIEQVLARAQAAAGSFAGRLSEANSALVSYGSTAERAAQFQTTLNAALGVRAADSVDYAARAADVAAWGSAIDSLRAKYVPLEAAQRSLTAAISETTEAQRVGVLSITETANAQAKLQASYRMTAAAATESARAEASAVEQANRAMLGIKDPNASNYASRASDIASYGDELDRLRAKFNPVFAVSKQYEATLDEISQAQKVGALTAMEAAAAIDRVTEAFAKSNAPAIAMATSLKSFVDVQARINQSVGLGGPVSDYASRAQDIEAYGNELDRLRAKYNPVFAVSKQYETTLDEIAQAQRIGALTAVEAASAADRATKAFAASNAPLQSTKKGTADLSESTGQAAFAMRQLGVQSIQMISGIASGQPVLTTFIQQGHQVVDVALSTGTGFGTLARGIGSMIASINPYVALGVVATAGTLALGAAAESSARRMETLRNQLSATREDYMQLATTVTAAAKAVAGTTAIGTADARSAGETIASASNFSGSQAQLQGLIKTAGDLALVMGKTVPEAAKELASALDDPAKAAADLANKHFPGMSQALAYSIKLQADAGDKAGAFARDLKVVQDATRGVDDRMTPLQKSLHDLSEAFTRTGQDGRSLADAIGGAITSAAAMAINAIAGLIGGIEALRQKALAGVGAQPVTPQGAASLTPDATGRSVLTNPLSGAMGIFQVMPDANTTKRYGYDLRFQDQNIAAGLQDLQNKFAAAGGDQNLALKNFGGFVNKDPSAYIAKIATANVASLPADVASQIEYWGQVLGLPPERIALGQRIAVVESGGRQYGAAVPTMTVSAAAPPQYGPPVPTLDQLAASRAVQSNYDDAFGAYTRSGVLSVQRSANQAQQGLLDRGIEAAQMLGDADAVAKLTEAKAKLRGEETDLISEQAKLARSATDAVAALSAQAGFEREMAGIQQQFAERARATGQAIDQQALAAAKAAAQTRLATEYGDAISATDLATAAQRRITAAYDGTAASLSHAQNYEKARDLALKKFQEDSPQFVESVDKYTASLDRGSDATRNFAQMQSSVADLANAFTQAFDTIGNSITQAFIQGQGAAVNWGNIMKGVVSQVVQQMLKLAVINPLINSLLGQNNGTLGSALAVLAGGGGAAASGQGAASSSGLLGYAQNLYSLGKTGYSAFTGGLSGGSYTGLGAGVDGFLGLGAAEAVSTSGATAGMTVPAAAADAFATAGGTTAATSAGFLGTGASLGAWGGGIGLGFAAGSLVGGLVQNGLGKTGPAPMIGAGIGAVGGAALGTMILPGIGTVIGGIAGGVLGGAGGGLIGPHAQSSWSSTPIGASGNLLNAGQTIGQQTPDLPGQHNSVETAIEDFNRLIQAGGLSLNYVPVNQIGVGREGNGKYNSLQSALPDFQFGAADQRMNDAVAGKSFTDFQSLIDVVTKIKDLENFTDQTMPALLKAAEKPESAFVQQINALRDTYNQGIDKARQLGVAEWDLVAARDKAIDAAMKQQVQAVNDNKFNIANRYTAAAAGIANDPALALSATLASFDQQATAQRQAWGQQLIDTYGLWIATDRQYADRMTELDRTLGEERLAIQQQYNDKLAQAASGPITSLTAYVHQLQTGSASPLSPQDQLKIAASQFDAVSGAASAGDINSLSSLSGYANTFLSASKSVNGSGVNYVSDFQKVLDVLSNVSAVTPDTLTSSVLRSETRTQTAILVDNIQALKDEVAALRRQVAQAAGTPAQLAA